MEIRNCLIVDDSRPDQFYAKAVIEHFDPDINIYQAWDGREALNMMSDENVRPDVIFLDINMPGMNGHEFLEEYNTWEDESAVVIMLTSSDQKKDIEKANAYKCVREFLTKPLDQDGLVKIQNL